MHADTRGSKHMLWTGERHNYGALSVFICVYPWPDVPIRVYLRLGFAFLA